MASPAQHPRITHDKLLGVDPGGPGRLRCVRDWAPGWCELSAWLGLIILVGLPLPAPATLGEDTTSTARDSAAMNASLQVSQAARYTIHELRTPAGTIVRQYASPSGSVFAVAWEGPLMPDLRQTLGRYFDRYAAAAASAQPGRRQVSIREPDFVVQASGQMRAFHGKAYLPQLLPQGVRADELQ